MKRRSMMVAAMAGVAVILIRRPVMAAARAVITIDNFTFSPVEITVAVGTEVTWTNRDDIPHTVVDRDNPKAMKSPPLDTDDSFTFTFTQSGTFHYFCSIHPHMQGTVVVQ
jgi:plastocyanin